MTSPAHFTLALAQINPTVGDLAGNAARMLDFARRAAEQGAGLVLYPEMCLTGYPPEDLVLIPAFRAAAQEAARELATAAAALPCDLIFGSVWEESEHSPSLEGRGKGSVIFTPTRSALPHALPPQGGGRIYNASLLASRGELTLLRAKHDLPNYGVFDEKRVFDVGAAPSIVEWRGIRLGVLICEEVWDVEQAKTLGAQGAEILLVQNASPYHIGKASQRKRVVSAAAAATGLPVVYLNLVGGQDELVFDGRSYAVAPDGHDVARLPAFTESLGILEWEKQTTSCMVPHPTGGRLGGGQTCSDAAGGAPTLTLPLQGRGYRDYPLEKTLAHARQLRQSMTNAEKILWNLLRKEQLGVKFRKQHPVGKYIADFACLDPKIILELDGGQHTAEKDAERSRFIESQGFTILRFWNHDVLENSEGVVETIALQLKQLQNPPQTKWHCVCAPMTELAGDEQTIYQALVLGLRDYVAKNKFPGAVLGLSGGIDSGVTAAIAADALGPDKVHTIRLPSPFTSDDSLEDAEQLAAALRLRLDTIPITPLMDGARQTLAPLFQGRHADTTEENIQARLRGLLLMAVSNKFGAMVLTTGNKSEMSVGYATLYGDMCGGFSVLKDVYKTTVVKLANWRAAAPSGVLNELGFLGASGEIIPKRMIEKPPTAELRAGQRDDDSLPPYAVLDTILRGLVERQLSIAEIVAEGLDEPTVTRVARMLANAEYKRRQSAPGVKITPMAFGRDRRWPITNRWKFA